MKKHILGYGLWLVLTACLYFFENNAGTRVILVCTLLLPLIPGIRHTFLHQKDKAEKAHKPQTATVQSFSLRENDEPGDVRSYLPGDPVNRIHWKLSAKRDELLVRELAKEDDVIHHQTKAPDSIDSVAPSRRRHRSAWLIAAILFMALLLLFLIPEARRGLQMLLNRIFEASEQRNAYVYDRFPVDAGQDITLTVVLLLAIALALLSLTIATGSRKLALGMMAGCVAFQIYFGLSFPALVNVPLFALFAIWGLVRSWDRRKIMTILVAIAAASLAVMIFLPGENGVIETASENVRDWLSQAAEQMTGTVQETASGESETRHVHVQSLITGAQEAQPDKEYRLVTVEEKQISMPHWVNYLRIALLLLLTIAMVILPFIPFLVLNKKRKQAEEAKRVFQSENVSEAVCAIFQHVVAWLEVTKNGAGNLPYVQWAEHLPHDFPANYDAHFARCAEAFTEAAYSNHDLTEETRQQALNLLEETEEWLFSRANWKQKLYLRYGKCLYA